MNLQKTRPGRVESDVRFATQRTPVQSGSITPLVMLHLLLKLNESSMPYNEFALAQAAAGHDVTVCSFFKSSLPRQSEIALIEGDGSIRGYLRALQVALARQQYDVVHAHSPHVGVLLLLAALIHAGSMPPTVCTIHNSYQSFKLRNRLMLLPEFAFCGRVVPCSHASRASFPALYQILGGRRIHAIPNGLNLNRIGSVKGSGPPRATSERFTIVSVNRLIERKRPTTVLKAFRDSNPSTSQLVFIGDGDLRTEVLSQSQEMGLEDHVTLTGAIAREGVYERLMSADLFVSASSAEGLPVAVLEAMACGCPVVLSDIPPHREIAKDTDFIPLVGPDDIAGFAREIARFRELSAATRITIGNDCRKLVERRFSLELMHERYLAVYQELIDSA